MNLTASKNGTRRTGIPNTEGIAHQSNGPTGWQGGDCQPRSGNGADGEGAVVLHESSQKGRPVMEMLHLSKRSSKPDVLH